MITRNTYTQGKSELAWDTWPIHLVLKLSLQSENETNDPLKRGPALAGLAADRRRRLCLTSIEMHVMNAALTVLNDDDVEGTETVVLMGSIPPGLKASFAPRQDRVIIPIWDNDGKY